MRSNHVSKLLGQGVIMATLAGISGPAGWAAPKAPKPPKACQPRAVVTPRFTLDSPSLSQGWANTFVMMAATDERCFCPYVELSITPVDAPFGSQSQVWFEAHEADCSPWREHPGIEKGEFVEATERRWSWRPGGMLGSKGLQGYFRLPRGAWELRYLLKQGAWSRRVTVTIEVVGPGELAQPW